MSGAASAAGPVRIYGYDNIRRHLQRKPGRFEDHGSIAVNNRHTGKPHEHRRAIARMLRQQDKLA